MGEVQYFTYPNEMNNDLAALDYIENQITESGIQQMKIAGGDFDMAGMEMEAEEIIM